MMRAALVIAIAGLAAAAGPAQSDPSYTVPPPSTAAPQSSEPQSPAPQSSVPQASAPPAAVSEPPKPPPAAAATEGGSARYSFHRVGDSFIRLDTQTGQVSKCGWVAAGWSCQAAADERAALDSEIARLQHENAELKKSLLAQGVDLPSGPVAEAPNQAAPVPPAPVPDPTPNKEPKGPSEVDVHRAIAFVKHVWQRLVDLMVDLQRDIQRRS
jgi:hypothetical protein